MKTVLGILYFCLCIGHCQVVAVYPMCGQPLSSMSGCCMLSQGSLRCTEVTCPDGYYNVVSSSTGSDSETSSEDNEAIVVFIYLRRRTRMSRKQASVECGQSFILSESQISLSWRETSFLPSPIISPQWQISEDFPWSGGVLKATSYGVCLEVGQGAVDITDTVTIRGAVSTDLTNAYDVLPLPPDEVIVSPVVEFFAGFYFRFEKQVRIVLPHFLSSDLPGDLVRVYEFHSENGRIKCCRLQVINTEDENPATTGYLFCGSKREIHVFTNHFSGYVCTVCEEACVGYYKPPEVSLRALAKHVLRCNGKREVMVRLDLWDSRFFSPDIQQNRQRTEVSTEDRQMVLVAERKLKSLDDSPDVGNTFIGARFQLSEEQTTFWSHVKTGGVNVCPMEQRLHVKELYPCRHQRPHNSMKWLLSDAKTNAPQEFECFIFVGYIDSGTPIAGSSFGNDQQKIIFMEYPQSVILPIRRAMKLDEDHPDSLRPLEQTGHGGLAEAKPSQTTHSENTNVKNLASLLQSSSLDSQTSSVNISQGCSMLRHESHSGHVRELSDTPTPNPVSIQHVNSINSLKLYVCTPPTRDEALGDLVFGADCGDTQERGSSLRNSVNRNITYPTPASDQ
ncbi:uncharacterized protein LOC112562475 [Pomacea canaliculata]|uniref:uncharacterized protein LOC112562475 n=1 Tax=Pomacea canaliculata TaxID=400727 RepID=UPI000D730EE4|nr:uncharacterized protein LOC112562475 [Pomacea canaliculata]